jgi:hypothetical protein
MEVGSKLLLARLIDTESFNAVLSEMAVITALKAEYFGEAWDRGVSEIRIPLSSSSGSPRAANPSW